MKRQLLARLGTLALASAILTASHAWPTKPLRVIVPAAAGSAPDIAMRLIGERIGEHLKQPVIVDNKPGAGGVAAMNALQASRDDHVLLFVITSTSAIAPVTIKAATGFDYLRDLRPVVRLAQTPLMIVANNNAPATLRGLVETAKNEPGKVSFGTPSLTSLGALSVAWLSQITSAQFNAVPFSRPADSLSAVTSGDTQYFIDGISVSLPFVHSGKVKPVAVLSRTKLPGLEAYQLGVDTYKDFEVVGRFGLMAPKEMPATAMDPIFEATQAALGDPDVVSKLKNLGFYPQLGTSAEYLQGLKAENELWRGVVKKAGFTPN